MRFKTHLVSCLAFTLATAFGASPSYAATLSLADMLGGGNGTGTGTPNTGYDQHSGAAVTGNLSQPNSNFADNNVYHVVNPNPYVDGIFVPDGGSGPVQVASTGLTATVPDTGGDSWENGKFFNAHCCGNTLTVGGNAVTPTNYIGLHPNVGLTFDLNAVRAANPGQTITQFTAIVGGTDAAGDASFSALLDGVVAQPQVNFTGRSEAASISFPISGQRFLTLLGTDQDLNYGNDGLIVGNPALTVVPEPGTLVLFGGGAIGLCLVARRRAR